MTDSTDVVLYETADDIAVITLNRPDRLNAWTGPLGTAYFDALDRSGGKDRCYLCRRTPAEVKAFFGFDEDGVPIEAEEFGNEVVEALQAIGKLVIDRLCSHRGCRSDRRYGRRRRRSWCRFFVRSVVMSF